jgi:hypothetical protein
VTQASQQDEADEAAWGSRRGDARPAAVVRRAARVAARRRWAAQAQAAAEPERHRRANAEAARHRTGKQRRGTAPPPVADRPADTAQRTVPEPARPLRRTNPKGGDSGGKAPARGEGACQRIVAYAVSEAAHDTPQAEPVAQATLAPRSQAGLARPQEASGAVQALPATWAHGEDRAAAVVALAP